MPCKIFYLFLDEIIVRPSVSESFGWILLNPEFICIIDTVTSYLGNWGKRVHFGNGVAEIQQKYERERKSGREKAGISVITLLKFLLSKPADRNQLWQYHCRNRRKKICGNYGNAIAENGRKKNK